MVSLNVLLMIRVIRIVCIGFWKVGNGKSGIILLSLYFGVIYFGI